MRETHPAVFINPGRMRRRHTSYADRYVSVVNLVLEDRVSEARRILRSIPGAVDFNCTSAREIPLKRQITVFRRDHFTCRYCGRRAVFRPVLRVLATLFPSELPWHPHGKMTDCHVAFWRDYASCDHLVPAARGGTSAVRNLVTACYMCNSIKQNWLIEELRWTLLPIRDREWDGLCSLYPRLIPLLPKQRGGYYERWLRALAGTTRTKTKMPSAG